MTKMIVTERNTYRKTESAHCHTVEKEMARCRHTLGRLMSILRSSLGAGIEQPKSSLRAAWSITLLLTLMTLGATNALAQTDYSGTYYIASVSKRAEGKDNNYTYNVNNPANNYYLCPTEGWCSYKATDDFEAGDNMPFLTTYKCRAGGYDATKAIWVIEKAPNSEYYYIKQWKTGKYLVSSGQINTAGIDRMRVHLESIADVDLAAAGDKVLFDISLNNKSQIVFSPQGIKEIGKHDNFDHSTHRWLTVNDGNYNDLKGHSGKGGGPTGYTNTSGVLGIFNKEDANAPLYLEDARVARPTFSMNDAGDVTITVPAGTTVHYTLDGTDPTAESATYSSVILAANIPAGQTVKAIAVPNAPTDKLPSVVATLPLITYHIVNKSNDIAISSSAIKQLAGTTLTGGYNSIPEELRSPYISDETITFYTMEGDFNANNLDNEHKITATPDESANIYVTYTTDQLGGKFLHLQMARPMNLKYNQDGYKYLYENNGNVDYDASEAATITTNNHLWYIGGRDVPDPYDVLVKNSTKTRNLQYASSTLSLGSETGSYFLTGDTEFDAEHHDITLTNRSTKESFTIRVNTVEIPTSYYLIDKKGKQIFGPKESTSDLMIIPSEWSSPLATYHYWRSSSFEETSSGTYILKEGQVELTGLAELGENEHVYITYDVKDDIDLDGRDLLNNRGGALGATYRLKFTDGTTFKQENGKDGIMTEAKKAVYPYSNGDASLYVYGEDQWTTQLASGASTRSRWLWYLEPAKDVLDPYHVRVSSYQSQTNYKDPTTEEVVTNFHSYLRTYKPEGYSGVVTGVTNNNPEAQGKAASATAVTDDLPEGSEYMLLGTDLNHLKLVTVDAIDGDRRTVNSFEQYWKNNPTVQGKLTTQVTMAGRNVTLSDAQKAEIAGFDTNIPWHVYKEYANSAPWMHNGDANYTTSKKFLKEEHVYQTISMGETFSLVETTIDPMLILLDQHGWEIARIKLPTGDPNTLTPEQKEERKARYAAIHKYSSPMVKAYHYYKTASKEPGYHKYKVDLTSHATEKNDPTKEYTSDALGVLVGDVGNLPDYGTQALIGGKERDWYVTYDVDPTYANAYTGAATKGETSSVPYLVKQGGKYAKINGTSLDTETSEPSMDNVPQELRWYVKPNFDIDAEMGYLYLGETGAQEEAESKEDTETAYYAAGKNGFDPYNVQIQSVSNTERYFTANTSNSTVTSSWEGTSSSISLQNMGVKQSNIMGLDQTHMKITNATFMVLDDGNGNMRLVPRFDNTKVMQNFTSLAAPGEAAAADDKGVSSQTIFLTKVPEVVNNSSEITVMGGTYLLSSTFSASGSIGTKDAPFTGTIEGQIGSSFDVSNDPFIAYAQDAVIKNVIIESSSVSSGSSTAVVDETEKTALGAICNVAQGNTRIYNCGVNGGSVSGSADYVGGIVGLLDGSARVINCYSYADITGGSTVGGIVGYNNYASTSSDLKTMVMNCMFYGNIDYETITEIAPIYNGKIISNVGSNGLGNYNYFLAEKPYVEKNKIKTYNCALMAEERFLNRFEFFRLLMNSHLELAGWYATDEYDASKMMKWVLETADRTITNPKPYPVLKAPGKYPSIINYDADNAPTSGERNTGKQLGTLSVTISTSKTDGGQAWPEGATVETTSLTLTRTDKDYDHFNFNYDKVQLPYYNDVGTKNYTGNRVVTGWKITSISGGTAGSYTTGDDATTDTEGNITKTPYNFADRNCTDKDLYTKSGRVFNQGAYWDVPEGVTAITIEPYWAEAVYLADSHADVVYNTTMTDRVDVSNVGGGQKYANGSTYSIAGDNQKVYTSMDNARKQITTGKTVYDCAIVLVGNAHNIGVPSAEGNRSYTIMSADFDHDNEPDYSYVLRFNGRTECHPVRTDFVNIPGLGMAQKSTGGTGSYNFGILIPKGWFESTNTSLFRFTQFEYEHSSHPADAPLILQGGVMEQWVSNNQKGTSNKIPYIHVGGNVWFKEFHTGCHQDKQIATKHSPISVTGGDYDEFYLTGLYRGDVGNKEDNAECYINGGRFGTVCGAAMEGIGKANGANNTGNIVWQIQNADIHEFYAGGLNAAKPVTGNLSTTITDSYVDIFCGGPKFGDMSDNKAVHTKATGCTFGTYFGAGYGGNSYSRYAPSNQNNKININWNNWLNGQYKQEYNATYGGVSTQFTYQFLPMSDNTTNVARILIDFVKFSLATTRNVTSNLTGCTVTGNFYGGGSLGKVDGNVTSTLNNCKVKGSAFGAGFSGTLPTVEVDAIGFEIEPYYYEATGTYRTGVKYKENETYKPIPYRWEKKTGNSWIDKTNHILYTTEDLTTLGTVTGKATLNITGNTLVEGYVFDASGNPTTQTGGVFGGGDASAALGNTEVNINATSQQAGSSYNAYNVFGGGNVASVGGTTTVNVNNGTVSQRVFGGGNEADVNTNANVVMSGGTVLQGVYGGCNTRGTIVGHTEVTLTGGTVGSNWGETAPNPLPDVVFGGGLGEPTLVNGDVTVNVGTLTGTDYAGNATIYGNVYGGSALGNTSASKTGSAPMVFNAEKTTNVNLYAGTINGNVFGGGLGRKAAAAIGTEGQEGYVAPVTAVESFVGGDVNVLLDGAKVQQVFGCNNLNGTPKGHVKVHVKQTKNFSNAENADAYKNNSETALDARTTYDVTAVYGGGNQADYNPTKATGTDDDKKEAFAEVLIEGCDKTSIEYVYGGGNAAAVPATQVTVESAYIIHQLFGGGNGKSTATFTNPGANIGLYNNGATVYGTGETKIELIGGQVHEVYGGSNTLGNVRGGTSLKRKDSNLCTLKIGAIYGAGQEAPMDGNVNIILECMPEEFVPQVFGGAKNAIVNGNVSLTVTSGKYGQVFGGNNLGGSINGSITVNVYEDGCLPLMIGELYGGGFKAPYSIYGCTRGEGDTWTANESGTLNFNQETEGRAAVEVNVYSCTSIGKVFGGGYQAPVIGNTHVWVNMMKGLVDDPQHPGYRKENPIGKIARVFGGGNEAVVKGNTTLDIGTATVNIYDSSTPAEDVGVNIESGSYLKPDKDETETLTAGIYGGGNAANVEGSTTLNIGTVNQTAGGNPSIKIQGDIFGGGYGESTLVTGNVVVNIGKKTGNTVENVTTYTYEGYAIITGDVYGGSAKGKVNSTDNGSTTKVNFYGGTIKDTDTPSGKGNIYGGGLGEDNEGTENDHAADVYGPVTVTMEKGSTNTTVNNVFGCNNVLGTPKNTVTVNINGGTVNQSVYGGGNQAAYTPTVELAENAKIYPAVNIINGTITENVFGGGLGTTATVTGNPHVTIGDKVEGHVVAIKKSVYGGGSLATVDGSTNIVVNGGTIGTEGEGGATYGNIYGGGFGSSAGVQIGIVKKNTEVTVNGGTILHNIYGGGAYGSVGTYNYNGNVITGLATENTGKATIRIVGGTIGSDGRENGMIFGASRGDIAAPGAIQDNMAWVYDTDVIIGTEDQGENVSTPSIKGSVYGSGENGHTFHDAKVTIYSGMVGIAEGSAITDDNGTPEDTSDDITYSGAAYPYRGNVYGGGCGTDKYYEDQTQETHDGKGTLYNKTAGIVGGDATVTISGGHVVRNVYGAGAMGSVTGKATVNISGKSIIGADGSGGGYIYTAARGNEGMDDDCATVGSTELNISGGTVWGSAFGGGQLGTVKGSVAVNVSGGVVKNDVYGGGALANTNTDNWETTNNTWKAESSESTDYYVPVQHLTAGTSVVTGYYTESGGNYTEITTADIKADANTIYYKKLTYPANIHNIAANGTTYKTTVNLTGGVIGNAYGGGLGQLTAGGETTGDGAVQAMVYGDVNVTVDGAAFTALVEASAKNAPVTGRVFGCNNINGTPKGKVTVVINKTKRIDGGNHTLGEFEIQGVYGGGNLAAYVPQTYDSDTEFGQGTKVIINDCEASISKVYGGGNAAVVPYTDVTINGAFEIGYVFGGGNGGDMINKNGNWIDNTGADVTHYTNVLLKGGTIGQAFGGSDSRGTVGGSNIRQATGGLCPLRLVNLYGAGNGEEASSAGDINIEVSGCGENNEIQNVFGGSYKANITGSVTLTIKSGIFTSVYGGNDRMGSIGGNITVNIEETDNCDKPIIIQNLYGGCYQTAYPGESNQDTHAPAHDKDGNAFTRGKITVNVKSATRIDRIFGGSERGDVTGDTEVNINMTKGSMSGHEHVTLPNYYAETGAFVPSNIHITNTNAWAQVYLYYPTNDEIAQGKEIPTVDGYYIRQGDSEPYTYTLASGYMVQGQTYYKKSVQGSIDPVIGTIGDVFGGGNIGKVTGSTVVNIGTEQKVTMVTISDKPETTEVKENEFNVLGVHINGDVFGGCNSNVVTGNATVNICTANYSALGSDFEGIYIDKTENGGGSVYGGGSAGDVLGNTNVTMAGGYVYDGVYGGGLKGSVGTFTRDKTVTTASNGFDHSTHSADCLGKPTACADGTGTCTVVVSGGQVGPVEVATKGMKNVGGDGPVDVGFVFGAGRGDVENPNDVKDADFHTFVNKTDVTISGGLIMASVYGGGENGRVLNDTHVKIKGGQIGCGEAPGNVPRVYTEGEWASASVNTANTFKECLSWDYKSPFLPHDPYAQTGDAEDAKEGTDGHTYYGSVFGGGSGYYPYLVKNLQGTVTGHEWLRSAGAVYGNTVIDITGGHILTCVYGGNETTDVGTYTNNDKGQPLVKVSGGKCTINMVGGTIGVPRTDEDAKKHPVTCYLFGAGKGDQRTRFNTWTNVQETEVNVSGTARIFGSVFGGGEDGHILGDAHVNIGGSVTIGETTYTAQEGLKIGTTGTSYVDGNVFGGGRGFSGVALTAGSTGGNTTVNISDGKMLGSIYGGGRLASVGIDFTSADDPSYGQLVDDKEGNPTTHGHITVNISGGTIGNDVEDAQYGGNVFGAGMGRNTDLNGELNELWPKVATSKTTTVSISGGTIKKNVYGGAEFGIVRNQAKVTISGSADIRGSVFGGGKGSDDYQHKTPIQVEGYDNLYYSFTPMLWNGAVSGNTIVNIEGGKVGQNVYGGGELASVGLIDLVSDEAGNFTNMPKHESLTNGFGLSWPYKFTYHAAAPNDDAVGGKTIGGKTTVNITGGHIGSTSWNDGTGYVFGGSKGKVDFGITSISDQRYTEAFCANVRETVVNVKYSSTPSDKTPSNIGTEANCIMGAVYGGGEDGHVYENAKVNITNGLIGLSVYGAGKGISTYKGYLKDGSTDNQDDYKTTLDDLYSWTAGKVYGNTTVTMTGGHVLNNIYGGGYLGSVGKGNYSGGADDYNPAGYGETLTGNLWTSASEGDDAWEFLHSGKATVKIEGGTVGTLNGTYGSVGGDDSMASPTGMVFGGSRGQAAEDIMLDPRYEYAPNFYLGYVNETEVTIGTESNGGPRLYGQVFGGGRDGHVRGSAHVIVNGGTIGQTYAETTAAGGKDAEYHRYHRGNVYGAGSGLGLWDSVKGLHGMSSGSVTNKTTVDINGGTIYNNVYGGGAMATVGPPRLDTSKDYAGSDLSKCTVNINGGTIGEVDVYNAHKFGGTIYGGSRGDRGGDLGTGETIENYASVLWTEVNINPHPTDHTKDAVIAGNVYGGARGGQVKKDTKVNLLGGVVKHNAYGGGRGTTDIAADVLGNTTVELNNNNSGSDVDGTKKGCIVDKIFGCNDLNGTPKGHVLVHVYGTQNSGTANMQTKVGPGSRTSLDQGNSEGYVTYLNRLIALAMDGNVVKTGIDAAVITAAQGTISGKTDQSTFTPEEETNISNAAKNVIAELQNLQGYDVTAVYGGGDLAPYVPAIDEDQTEVIIEGCDVTSIKQVYGGGNAAYVPATNVLVKSAYVIDELFGGGNGLDNYVKDGKWYENPGANVGYKELEEHVTDGTKGDGSDEAHKYGTNVKANANTPEGRKANYAIGTGIASTTVNGGYIHNVYGGSNMKGNIRAEALLQVEQAGTCALITDKTYAGSKQATIDAETNTVFDCVKDGGEIYGGSQNADILNDVHVRITNGSYTKVFGGNEKAGTISGSITIDIEEKGCTPIEIDELYAGGYLAPYSVYGYETVGVPAVDKDGNPIKDKDGNQLTQKKPLKKNDTGALATPYRDPQINIISATKIGKIYGGGYQADLIGSPHINVNMTRGVITKKYASEYPGLTEKDSEDNSYLPIGTIGTIFGGGNKGDVYGDTYLEIGTGEWLNLTGQRETTDADGKVYVYNSTTKKWDWTKKVGDTTESGTVDNKPAPARNAAYVLRDENTGGQVFGGGDQGYVFGNTNVNIGNGYIYDRVYGGGNEGTVGHVSTRAALPEGHSHTTGCLGGKPAAFETGTGKSAVTVSGGYVGPFTYTKSGSTGTATITPMTMPQDFGYVFGAGRGKMGNPAVAGNEDIEFMTYVNETNVIIKNTYAEAFEGDSLAHIVRSPLIAGGVYGGSENGRVLNNTHVNIWGGQIGLGATKTAAYAETAFIDPTTTKVTGGDQGNALDECAAWTYGNPWLPYDEHAGNGHYQTATYGNASTTGTDGHTFYGNVFGGGSGYFAYETTTTGVYEWLPSAGLVEGDTYVNISGGHILTNVYGGNEMTNVTGTAHVTMTGGTLGVPRTLETIAAHPVTCYLFGGGKGDQRVHFNKSTNVGHAKVNVSGGIIYGSVFGGGEDGHVLGDVTMNISDGAKIGTWGTSYVDGNVFGGGRGFGGDAYTAGNVAGSVTLNITGGTMLGSVYGGGRLGSVGYGLFSKNETGYGTMRDDNVTEDGFTPPGGLTKGRGHVTVNISGDNTVIGNKYEYQYISPETTGDALATAKTYLPSTQFESNNRLKHTRGGNVFAGGMGRYTKLDGTSPISTYDGSGNLTSPIEWKKLGNVKSTKLTISGNPWIMGNVYGGGELGAVTPYTDNTNAQSPVVQGGTTTISITGGTIGTEVTGTTPEKTTVTTAGVVQYTYGSVYGGGMGMEGHDDQDRHGGEVGGNTTVTMSGENTEVRASVYGGGEMAVVDGNTTVTINNGKIGRNEVKPADNADAGYVMFGGATMGNVYGGGKGSLEHTEAGLVKGNTNVTISGGNVYHNVYGGGALGSVGTFSLSNGTDAPSYIPIAGVPYDWKYTDGTVINPASPEAQKTPTGTATVTITGGTIGISGRDNGLVFGSSRGNLTKPVAEGTGENAKLVDPYDRVAWVNKSVVTIGTSGSGATLNTPLVKGSVYGGGENGHNSESATVNVYSGTIGVTNTDDPWYSFTDKDLEKDVQLHRGNVYGAGSGTDTYTGDDGAEYWNQKSGMVGGNTFVNIAGGHVGRAVYGGGAMASVGTITKETKHESIVDGFGLSWPYAFEFAANTGKATVNVTGGHIGTRQLDGGDVFGSSRGEAGDRYDMAKLALTNETEVNINYPTTIDMPTVADIQNDFSKQCITGSVHGSGENGYVYGDTKVTLSNGLIGHSLYGAGKGKGTYTKALTKIGGGGTYDAKIYSLIAGKVMGNTEVTMNGGRVGRNVYGGGNMGSVGKGNYAGGADDYYPAGYGETITGNLWTSTNEGDDAWQFLNSGKTTVKVLGGTVGYIDATDPTVSMKNQLPYGNVFGGSAGEAAPNIAEDPRYEYSPAFFSGYVNETDVTIGKSRSDFATDDEFNTYLSNGAPKIYASVYGGGQDGHVRRDTKVTVNSGEIGVPYKSTSDSRTALLTNYGLDDPQWMHRGNIYGGGSGITKYKFDLDGDGKTDKNDGSLSYNGKPFNEEDYSSSSGSVTLFTEVNVLGGTIHRNVYGGGSMGSVGAPTIPPTRKEMPYKYGTTKRDKEYDPEGTTIGRGWWSQNTVNIGGGATVVTIGTPYDTAKGWTYNKTYGGEVYGACRGMSDLDPEQFANSVWTLVNIKDKATIMGNVYGGGDNGIVKKDSEVKVGEEKVQP